MSLEGNLTAFGLSEILQLVAVQQKSGMLAVSTHDRSKVLFFREGQIISTRDRRRKTKDPLKDYLTRYGIVSRDDLMRVVQIASQSKLDIVDVILSEGFLTDETIALHYRNHIQEEVHEVLTWEQCSYKFIPGNDVIDGIKLLGQFSIEGMLMESMRRIDETPGMLEMFPDIGIKISRKGEPDEETKLTTNERNIHELLGDTRTISYLISRGRAPRFDVYEALKHLNDKGLIAVDLGASAIVEETVTGTRQSKKARKYRNVAPLLASIVGLTAAAIFGGRSLVPELLSAAPGKNEQRTHGETVKHNRLEAELRFKLEAYRAMNGTYPANLAKLTTQKLADAGFLDEVKASEFRYHLTEGGGKYTLVSSTK